MSDQPKRTIILPTVLRSIAPIVAKPDDGDDRPSNAYPYTTGVCMSDALVVKPRVPLNDVVEFTGLVVATDVTRKS